MADRPGNTIRIGELNIQVPGASPEQGHRIAQNVAESLSRRIPDDLRRNVGALQIRIGQQTSASNLGDTIAVAVTSALTKRVGLNNRT